METKVVLQNRLNRSIILRSIKDKLLNQLFIEVTKDEEDFFDEMIDATDLICVEKRRNQHGSLTVKCFTEDNSLLNFWLCVFVLAISFIGCQFE